jgi:hypothetical protein
MFNLDFYTFNALEGIFWIALGFVVAFFVLNGVPRQYRFLGVLTSLTLLIFGLSDFLENHVGGFMHANEWLFLGKAICLLALCVAIGWYIKIRRGENLY